MKFLKSASFITNFGILQFLIFELNKNYEDHHTSANEQSNLVQGNKDEISNEIKKYIYYSTATKSDITISEMQRKYGVTSSTPQDNFIKSSFIHDKPGSHSFTFVLQKQHWGQIVINSRNADYRPRSQ